MNLQLSFPTSLHQEAAELARDFFLQQTCVDTVLVVNSCARGQATPESDLDMAILVKPGTADDEFQHVEALWQQIMGSDPLLARFRASHRFAHLHLDLIRGQYTPTVWDDGGGPDSFEIEVGNQIAYSAPFNAAPSPAPSAMNARSADSAIPSSGLYFQELQAHWLPYYNEALRLQRLPMIYSACANDLEHVPYFVRRELYFQAFDRLYRAFQEFLQGLFIAQRVYPLAYNKWIRLQVESWLGLPELYCELPLILSIQKLESDELSTRAQHLQTLLDAWVHV
ncbi:MAG: nucleotidyltransferase domain-containing protein [Caldilineaceae bacterium]